MLLLLVTAAAVASPVDWHTLIGTAAAICTTASYLPQLKKCWDTGSAGDLSLKMFTILAAGIGLWVIYGALKSDIVIVLANSISLVLLGGILYFRLREPDGHEPTRRSAGETRRN